MPKPVADMSMAEVRERWYELFGTMCLERPEAEREEYDALVTRIEADEAARVNASVFDEDS